MNEERTSFLPAASGRIPGMAAVAILVATMLAAAGCDRFLGADGRVERASESYADGRYTDAMRDVKTALESEPDNVAGRILLARISLSIGDAEGARKELDRAIESGADPAGVRDLHYDILLAQGRYEDALIAAAVDEDLAPARKLFVQASAHLALGQNEEAGKSIAEALALEPGNRDALILQARWLWATGKLGEASTLLGRLTSEDPSFALAWSYKGRLALGSGDTGTAIAAFGEALKTAKGQLPLLEQLAVHAGLVEARLGTGDLAGAEADLKALEGKASGAFLTRYLRARLAYAKTDYRAAVAELQRALSLQPDNDPARLLLSASLLDQGATEQAEAELSRLISDHPDNIEARKLLARVLMGRNDVVGARRVLANAATDTRDVGADWLSGALQLVSGQTAEAIATLEQVSREDPGNVPLRLDLARAYLAAGRRDDAVALLATIPPAEGGPRRRQLDVMAEVMGRDRQGARAGIDRLVQEHASDGETLSMAAAYLLAIGDLRGARDVYAKAVAAAPGLLDAQLGLAAASLRIGDAAAAEAALTKAIELDPKDERAYLGKAGILLVRGDRAGATQWLERAIGANPAAVEARLQLAGLALAAGDVTRMKALAEQALTVTKSRTQTLNRVGQLFMQASSYDEALQRFNEAATAGLDDAGVNAALALLAVGRNDEARARLEALSSRRRDWAAPVVFLAAIDAGQKRFDAALDRVVAFERAGGSPPAAEEMRSDVLLAAGKPAEAAAALERAAKLQPSSGVAVKLYRARRAAAERAPEASLLQWLEVSPTDVTARVLLAEFYQQQGDRKSAIRHYEAALQTAFSPAVMNNLAWLYYETGDSRALDLARRAYDAQPDRYEIADTYGWILVESGRVADGLPVLEKAARAAPDQPDIQYHLAAARARAGRKEEALRSLESLLDQAPAFASRADAEKLLKSLRGG